MVMELSKVIKAVKKERLDKLANRLKRNPGWVKIGRSKPTAARNIWKYIYQELLQSSEKYIFSNMENLMEIRYGREHVYIVSNHTFSKSMKSYAVSKDEIDEVLGLVFERIQRYGLVVKKLKPEKIPKAFSTETWIIEMGEDA